MKSKVVLVRRRFTKLDKALLLIIGVLVVLTIVLARTTLNLANDTMALSDQLATTNHEYMLTVANLEARVASLEQERKTKDSELNLISVQYEPEAPRTLGYQIPMDIGGLSQETITHTYQMAQEYGVPFAALIAIMDKESGFGADIDHINTNGSTDIGIMQINSCNWDWLKERYDLDVNDESDNIEAGALILSMVWSKYTPEEAFAAYNMGEGNLQKYGVNDYGRDVYQMYLDYETMLGG